MSQLEGILGTSLQKIKEMADVNTIIGDAVKVSDKITLIPVSKVSFGFASGGSDFPSKKEKDFFGGGSGGGVTIQPIAFIVVTGENVKLLQINDDKGTAEKAVSLVPEMFDKVAELFKSKKKETTDIKE